MPIIPAFDPATGASGGPAVVGATGFAWRQILDFNTLTFSDPNGLVAGYSTAGGLHSLSLASILVANANYNFGVAPNFTGARWTFPLVYLDGSPVVAGDTFTFSSKVDNLSVGAARTWHIAVAAVQNPTSTLLVDIDGLGVTFGVTGVGTPLIGTWRRNGANTASYSNGVTIYGQSLFGGLPGKVKVGASGIIQSAVAGNPNQGLDTNILSAADNAQMYGMIAVGSLGTATTIGGTMDFRLFYNVEKLS